MKIIQTALALVLSTACLGACASTDEPEPAAADEGAGPISIPGVDDPNWALTIAYAGDVRINGVATGELDFETPGDEIVTVDRLGHLRIMHRVGDGFEEMDLGSITATGDGLEAQGTANAPTGELVQVICTDLIQQIPGDEIVAVGVLEGGEDDGGKGLVRVFARAGVDRAWMEYRFVTPALVHAVTAGDIVPARPGTEFLVAGFFGEAFIGRMDTLRGRPKLVVEKAEGVTYTGNAKGACLTKEGLVIACDNGSLTEFSRAADGVWAAGRTTDLGAALARVAAYPGGGVVVCANDGTLRIVREGAAEGVTDAFELVKAGNRLRGAVVADLDPGHAGDEIATAGYDGLIRLIRVDTSGSTAGGDLRIVPHEIVVAHDTAKIHHLTAGTFDGLGLCLVTCGYSGDVLVVCRAAANR